MSNSNLNLAVLFDAENASATIIESLLAETTRYGVANIKRAYGDWTTSRLAAWKAPLNTFAIQPVQQFSYTTGKNATDSALIIDAMDLLYTNNLDAFCLVSSDSDFTRLATRIREAGLTVYGFGERKTPAPFVAACNKFIYTEILGAVPSNATEHAQTNDLEHHMRTAIEAAAEEDGWSRLSSIGSLINKNNPAFDPRNYGHPKLSALVRKLPYLTVKEVPIKNNPDMVQIYVRTNTG